MEFTRKNYLELFRDGQPVIASGRTSNRHTTIVEAGEHAEQHAKEIGVAGSYEVRVDGGLYYMVHITELVLDAELDPEEPPAAQAEFNIQNASYSVNEGNSLNFIIERSVRQDQLLKVDWAITNASVLPASGVATFAVGLETFSIGVIAQQVTTSEQGLIELSNPQYVSGPSGAPLIGSAQPTADIFVIDVSQSGPLAEPDPNQATYFAGTPDEVADIDWRIQPDLVTGLDWSFPYTHVKKFAGAFQNPSGEQYPTYWRAGKLRRVNLEWEEMETSKNNYAGVDDAIAQLDQVLLDGYDGAHVNVRCAVVASWRRDNSGNLVPTDNQVTCPQWFYNEIGIGQTELGSEVGGRVFRNVLLKNQNFQTRIRLLIDKLEEKGFFTHPAVHNQLFHAASNSQGEEATFGQWEDPTVRESWNNIITYWMDKWVAAGHPEKAMWLNADEPQFSSTVGRGAGNRSGGSIEAWVRNKYFPGNDTEHGGVAEVYVPGSKDHDNGEFYFRQNKDFIFPKENRAWQEQNERGYGDQPEDRFHYRMAHLRCAQLRFDNVFIDEWPLIDARCDHWLSMQMGQQPEDQSCEAFCYLGEFYGRGGDQITPFANYKQKNMEHNLYQREYHGATTATDERQYNKGIGNATFNGYTKDIKKGWFARRGTNIGFAVDDAFITGAQAIAIKISFKDQGTHSFTLEYNAGGGIGSGTRTHQKSNSGDTRTATWFLNDFRAWANGLNPDFYITGNGLTDFYMVRIIKI